MERAPYFNPYKADTLQMMGLLVNDRGRAVGGWRGWAARSR
jgi:hypothetical protein